MKLNQSFKNNWKNISNQIGGELSCEDLDFGIGNNFNCEIQINTHLKRTNMKIEFELSLSDYMAFQEFHLLNSKEYKRGERLSTILPPAVLLGMLLWDSLNGEFSMVHTITFAIISIFWILYHPKRYKQNYFKKVQRMLNEGDNSSFFGQRSILIDNTGIQQTSNNSESKFSWSSIIRTEENMDYYFLYNSAISAIIIPKKSININQKDFKLLLDEFQS